MIKTIVQGATASLAPSVALWDPHFMRYPPGKHCILDSIDEYQICHDSNIFFEHAKREPQGHPHFQLNHYSVRSVEEYLVKFLRGTHATDRFKKEDLPHHINYAGRQGNCLPVINDSPTQQAASAAAALQAALRIPPWMAAPRLPPLPQELRKWSPPLSEFYDAIAEQRTWDEAHFLRENASRQSCSIQPPADGLMTFWTANKASIEGGGGECSVRFTK